MRLRLLSCSLLSALALTLVACGDNAEPEKPVFLRGHVISSLGAPISGARVTAIDVNDAPVTTTAVTDAEGFYELDVSSSRGEQVKLRASAAGFETFPSGIRRSLPISLSTAVEKDKVLVVSGLLTEITLEPLENATGLGSLSGKIAGSGALVVAEGPSVRSGIANVDGEYVIFNLLPGQYDVRAYVSGSQFTPATATVAAGEQTLDVDLAASGAPLGSVTGSVSIVNAPGGSKTSVVLVVASTFNEVTLRGEVPPGLRSPKTGTPDVTGSFVINGVPDGTYKVLAAFENDGLVRDPDPNIAGTQIVEVTVNGNGASLPTSFKITEALAVVSPGESDEPTPISGTPTLTWADDSSEDYYTVEVFDSSGNILWSDPSVPGVSGSPTVSVVYGGPALESGHTYQFRATSWKQNGGGGAGPISSTEDLLGLMTAQ